MKETAVNKNGSLFFAGKVCYTKSKCVYTTRKITWRNE